MAVSDVFALPKKEEIKEKKKEIKKLALNYHNSLYNDVSSLV